MSEVQKALARQRKMRALRARQNATLVTAPGPLSTVGPGPGGYVDPELYRMGAIGRRTDDGPASIQATPMESDRLESFGSGLVKGATGLMDLPGAVMSAAGEGAAALAEPVVGQGFAQGVRSSLVNGPLGDGQVAARMGDTAFPGAREFEPQTTAGKYAQTVGEFLPASVGGGPGAIIKGAVIPALASEAAGQATEGTPLEGAARLIGAVSAPVAIQGATNRFNSLFKASQVRPTVENLKATKTAAYKAVDDAGEVFTGRETRALFDRVKSTLDDSNYVAGVDKQTDAVLTLLERKAGSEMTLGQIDKVRQNLFKRYGSAQNETQILDAIDSIDDLIASREATSATMKAARAANARYKKAELLDVAFRKAEDQTASTGSGGNILNKYRQAVTSIINNPRQAKWFSQQEIDVMRNFVRGDMPENVLRRIGKLAPGGNGLMLALNMGAVAVDPTMLAVTATAQGAKSSADAMARRGAENVMRQITGVGARQAARRDVANAARAGLSATVNR